MARQSKRELGGYRSGEGIGFESWLHYLLGSGALMFGALFAATWLVPEQIERAAETYMVSALQHELQTRFGASIGHQQARTLARRLSGVASDVKDVRILRPDLVARVVTDSARDGQVADLVPEPVSADERVGLPQSYRDVFVGLLRELRVFSSTNALLFLLALAAWSSARARYELLRVPTLALMASTAVALALYFTSRSLLWTLLASTHVGYGYLVWVGILFAGFMDVLSNQARGLDLLARLLWFAR